MTNLMLFTSKTCHQCPEAKEFLDSKGIEYEVMEVGTNPRAMELAQEHRIMVVPTILVDKQVIAFEKFKETFD